MKYITITMALIALGASAVAQLPKKTSPEKPNLSDSFSRACLKALSAIRDFKEIGNLTGPTSDAYEDARAKANSTSAPETLMLANLTNFAIMRSADNLARENIMQKATAKVEHDGGRPNTYLAREKVRQDQELSASMDSINERESGCAAALETAFRRRIAVPLPGTCSGK